MLAFVNNVNISLFVGDLLVHGHICLL